MNLKIVEKNTDYIIIKMQKVNEIGRILTKEAMKKLEKNGEKVTLKKNRKRV